MQKRFWTVGVALASMFCGLGAPQAEEDISLGRAIELYRSSEFATSVVMLEKLRAKGTLSAAELDETAFYLGSNFVALNSQQAARQEFTTLLERAPGYEMPQYTSPKVAAIFREIAREQERAPRLQSLPPRQDADQLELRFEPSRQGRAFGSAQFRLRGQTAWQEAPLHHQGSLMVTRVPVERAGTIEFFAESRSKEGWATAGSAERPLEANVLRPGVRKGWQGARPWPVRIWPVWLVLGVAVATVAVAVPIAVTRGEGTRQLGVKWP